MIYLRLQVSLFLSSLIVPWVSGQGCGNVQLTENHGTFTSPNYPGKYDHKANCTWTITAPESNFIQIVFDRFDVKDPFWNCEVDYVTVTYDAIRSQKFCNSEKPPEVLKSTTNKIMLKLISDRFFMNGVGFSATYDVVDKYGSKLAKEEEVDAWDEEMSSTITEKSATTKRPTTTTRSSTATTNPSIKKGTSSTSSTLLEKITTAFSTLGDHEARKSGDGISKNAGAVSGVVLGAIIGIVLIVLVVILLFAFVRYRRNKNKRINLSVIETSDNKELIKEDKVYKKQGRNIVRIPEAEAFPL